MKQTNLNTIAADMLNDCPDDSRADHEKAAAALRAGDVDAAIAAIEAWPETYSWLRAELKDA